MPGETARNSLAAPSADFDASCADRLVGFLASGRDKLNLDKADLEWGLALVWIFGHVAPVTCLAQHDAYASEIAAILSKAGAPLSKEATAALMRTPDGMRAIALVTRMGEWKNSGH